MDRKLVDSQLLQKLTVNRKAEEFDPEELTLGRGEGSWQLRYDLGQGLEEFSHELELHGQLNPIFVNPQKIVVVGHRRTRAFMLMNDRLRRMGKKPRKIRGITIDVEPQEAALINLMENLHHKALTPMDKAFACERLIAFFGFTQARVAALFGKTQPWVSKQLSVFNLPLDLQEQISAGELNIEVAHELAALPPEHRDNFTQLMEMQGRKVTAASIKRYVNDMKNGPTIPARDRMRDPIFMRESKGVRNAEEIRGFWRERSDNKRDLIADIFRLQLMWMDGLIHGRFMLEEMGKLLKLDTSDQPQQVRKTA